MDAISESRLVPTGHLGTSPLFPDLSRHSNSCRWNDLSVAVSRHVRGPEGEPQLGLVTRRALPVGAVVGLYGDVLLRSSDFDHRAQLPVLGTAFPYEMKPAHMPGWILAPALGHWMRTHPGVAPGEDEWARRFSLMVLANEAPEPTQSVAYCNNMTPIGATVNGRSVAVMITTRDVRVGEELFWNYGNAFDRAGWQGCRHGNTVGHRAPGSLEKLLDRRADERGFDVSTLLAARLVEAGIDLPCPDDGWTCTSFAIGAQRTPTAPRNGSFGSSAESDEALVERVLSQIQEQTGFDLRDENTRLRSDARAVEMGDTTAQSALLVLARMAGGEDLKDVLTSECELRSASPE